MLKNYLIYTLYYILKLVPKLQFIDKFRRKVKLSVLMRKDIRAWGVATARDMGVKIGDNVRIYGQVNFGREPFLIEIGDNSIISGYVKFINHDGAVFLFNDKQNDIFGNFGKIRIGKNCFIGNSSIILPNVEIGDNCLVAAGSVVMNSFKPNSVIMGNPAKLIYNIEIYKRIKMKSKYTIRSERYGFPNEEDLSRDEQINIIKKELLDLPFKRK